MLFSRYSQGASSFVSFLFFKAVARGKVMVEIVCFDFVRHILQVSERLRESYLSREVDKCI